MDLLGSFGRTVAEGSGWFVDLIAFFVGRSDGYEARGYTCCYQGGFAATVDGRCYGLVDVDECGCCSNEKYERWIGA